MLKWDLNKKTVVKVEGSHEEEIRAKPSGSGADSQPVAKTSHRSGKGILNVNGKLRNRNAHTHHRHGNPKKPDFAAFNADYHVPRPHPPKHN